MEDCQHDSDFEPYEEDLECSLFDCYHQCRILQYHQPRFVEESVHLMISALPKPEPHGSFGVALIVLSTTVL